MIKLQNPGFFSLASLETPKAGRPKGRRNKLSEAFIHDCWSRRGIQVLEEVATKEPAKLLAAMIQLMPKDVLISVNDNRPMIELRNIWP